MSTYYATFKDSKAAIATLADLLQQGVKADDISLISPDLDGQFVTDLDSSLVPSEDATSFVGRNDDPDRDGLLSVDGSSDVPEYQRFTTLEEGPIAGIDTSDSGTNVDSVDQADDSQEIADQMTYPRSGTSFSEHQRDEDNLSMLTGFPTPPPIIEELPDTRGDEPGRLESISVPGLGMVVGGGGLATAALDPKGAEAIFSYLRDEGVPEDQAREYRAAVQRGVAMLAVAITPGLVDENAIERIVERHDADNGALFDAPRYYRNGHRPE